MVENLHETDVLEKFKELLSEFGILQSREEVRKFYVDIHGYQKHIFYPDFRLRHFEEYPEADFSFIDEVKYMENYGFLLPENGSDKILGQHQTTLSIKSIRFDPSENYLNFDFIIEGMPEDIDIIADTNPFEVKLTVIGCLNNELFWKQSLYLSYLMYKRNNLISCFMHLFITFEGLIRHEITDTSSSVHQIFKNYTGKRLPEYLNAYRKIRNTVMHGNENIAALLSADDIGILLTTIDILRVEELVPSTIHYTSAIEEGVKLP